MRFLNKNIRRHFQLLPFISGLSTEYRAILTQAIALGYTLPDSNVQILQNNFVKDLVSAGLWTKLDHLKIYAGSNADFSLINWINPTTFLSTKVNSPTYGYAYGWAGNATTAHLETNFTPSGSLNYKQNDACYFRYRKTESTVGQPQNYSGAYAASLNTYIGSFGNAGNYDVGINAPAVTGTFGTTTIGLVLINRDNAANFKLWLNNVNLATIASASTGIPTVQFLTCKVSVTNASDAQYSMEGAGASLTNSEISILTNSFSTYLNAL